LYFNVHVDNNLLVFISYAYNIYRNKDPEALAPINTLYSKFSWLVTRKTWKCEDPLDVLILVKSAIGNMDNRDVIRKTYQKSPIGVASKVFFFVGRSSDSEEILIQKESREFQDIVQIDFMDSYFNNTIKTMVEMRWAVEECPQFQYALLVDDDYFVSVKNLYKFAKEHDTDQHGKLYAGYKMFPKPLRHKICKLSFAFVISSMFAFNSNYQLINQYPLLFLC
jgi:hypothetical protein